MSQGRAQAKQRQQREKLMAELSDHRKAHYEPPENTTLAYAREAMGGKRNWDFVAFGDYASDMRENAEQAAAAIRFVKGREQAALQRAAFLELALANALKQLGPGASAVVHDHLIHKMPEASGPDLIFERCEYDQTYRVRAS